MIDDVVSVHAENWDFFKHAIVGDYVLEFKKRTVLYRLPGHQIINLGPAPITPSVAN